MQRQTTVAVIGGSGAEGGGLALRLADAGYPVVIGSRDTAKAEKAATSMNERLQAEYVSGTDNAAAAAAGNIVILAVPYAGQKSTAQAIAPHLAGKILIDATVPLVPPKVSRVQLPPGGSAVASLQDMLGPEVKVVAAFQNVSAHHLGDLAHEVACDVLVCGNDAEACETAIALVGDMGMRAIYAGPICNAAAMEALTSVLITINRRYKVAGSGLRITGL